MAQTFQGDVSFTLNNAPSPHRFEVCVTDENKIIVWIEDKQSKKQWHTDPLTTQSFVTRDNAIPKADVTDYAQRFATCLGSTDEAIKYGRSLLVKRNERVLGLTLPLRWAIT